MKAKARNREPYRKGMNMKAYATVTNLKRLRLARRHLRQAIGLLNEAQRDAIADDVDSLVRLIENDAAQTVKAVRRFYPYHNEVIWALHASTQRRG
jgi:hypothetical protein